MCFRAGTRLTAVRAACGGRSYDFPPGAKTVGDVEDFVVPLAFPSLRSGIRTLGAFALFVWWLWRCILQLRNVQRIVLIINKLSPKG